MRRCVLLVMCIGCAGIDSGPSGPDQISPLPAGKRAVVLAHGFGGTADDWDPAIEAAITGAGHAVLRTEVPSVEGVAERATAMVPQLDEFLAATQAAQVDIIAHSMGGLDARYLIAQLGYAAKTRSLTTISSPHRGTPLADVALGLRSGDQAGAQQAIGGLVGDVDPAALDRALRDLAEANAAAFATANPDAPGVTYQSFAGFATPNAIANPNGIALCAAVTPDATRAMLLLPTAIVAEGASRLPNDGIVGVASAAYGTFKGCIPADHLDEVGVPALVGAPADPSGSGMTDLPAFYLSIVDGL